LDLSIVIESLMQINLYATFRLIAGCKSLTLDLPTGTPLRAAIDEILRQLPDLRRHWVTDEGEMHAHVHVLINGQEATTLEGGWMTPLKPDDVVDFIPPVAGG
jgi:MoaD family protein